MTLASNPRTCAPPDVTRDLSGIVESPALAVVVDVEAIELERQLVLALDGVSHAGVDVVLVSREREPPLEIARARRFGPVASPLAAVRRHAPGARLIVIGGDPALFDELHDGDRGLSLGEIARTRVTHVGKLAVRAALWWIVKTRDRERRDSGRFLGRFPVRTLGSAGNLG